jgi:hypothetical protein
MSLIDSDRLHDLRRGVLLPTGLLGPGDTPSIQDGQARQDGPALRQDPCGQRPLGRDPDFSANHDRPPRPARHRPAGERLGGPRASQGGCVLKSASTLPPRKD